MSIPRFVHYACTIVSLCLTAAATAQEWTRFRGPNGTGINDAAILPAQWSRGDHAWAVRLPGIGHSSPVVWRNRVFLLSGDPQTATRYALCYSATNGDLLWSREFPSSRHNLHVRNSFGSSTPAVDEERVYLGWSTPSVTTLIALDHESNTVWERDLGPFVSQHGFGTSPIVHEDMVIMANQQREENPDVGPPGVSFLLAVDRQTGQDRWRTPLKSTVASYSVPFVYQPNGGPEELILNGLSHGIASFDPLTGRQNWSIEAFTLRTVSSSVAAGEFLVGTAGSGGGGHHIAFVRPGAANRQPEVVKKITQPSAPYVPTPVVKNDLVFLWSDTGIVSCLRAGDLSVVWEEDLNTTFSGSPVIAGEKMYCMDDEGVVWVLAADDEFRKLGQNPLGEPTRSTPAISGGRMFLRTYSHLVCIAGESL